MKKKPPNLWILKSTLSANIQIDLTLFLYLAVQIMDMQSTLTYQADGEIYPSIFQLLYSPW